MLDSDRSTPFGINPSPWIAAREPWLSLMVSHLQRIVAHEAFAHSNGLLGESLEQTVEHGEMCYRINSFAPEHVG